MSVFISKTKISALHSLSVNHEKESAYRSSETRLVKEILAECDNGEYSRFQVLMQKGGKRFVREFAIVSEQRWKEHCMKAEYWKRKNKASN